MDAEHDEGGGRQEAAHVFRVAQGAEARAPPQHNCVSQQCGTNDEKKAPKNDKALEARELHHFVKNRVVGKQSLGNRKNFDE